MGRTVALPPVAAKEFEILTIYHAPHTRGYRVIWLCEELSTPYRVEAVDTSPAYRASAEWRQLNPVGKLPVLRDGELTMFESGAMMQYVLDRYGGGRLQPEAGSPEHALFLQWCWFAESTFSRPLGEIVNHRRAFGELQSADVIDEMAARAELSLKAVDEHMANNRYMLGAEFSAVDITMGYTLRMCERLLSAPIPDHAAAYWARLQQRRAFAATEIANMCGKGE